MEDAELAEMPANGGSRMQDLSAANLNAALSSQPQPKSQIHILEVTKKALVEAARTLEGGSLVQGRRGTRRKHLAILVRQFANRSPIPAAPGTPKCGEHVAKPIDNVRIFELELRRTERCRPAI